VAVGAGRVYDDQLSVVWIINNASAGFLRSDRVRWLISIVLVTAGTGGTHPHGAQDC
jgi:hypothetical protein